MSEQVSHKHSPQTDDDPIVPIDFTPRGAEKRGFRLPFTTAGVAVTSMLGVFVGVSWFVLTARSVVFNVSPAAEELELSGAISMQVGQRFLVREGDVTVNIHTVGYYDYNGTVAIGEEPSQSFAIELIPLPGFLDLDSGAVSGAEVVVDGEVVGMTPMKQLELAAGEHTLSLRLDRYENIDTTVMMEGRSTSQSLSLALLPAWADVQFATSPVGALVTIDGVDAGQTPLTTEVLAGEHEVLMKLGAHKGWTGRIAVVAREAQTVPSITLEPADGLVQLRSTPANAGVTLDGTYQGQTPLELQIPPGKAHRVAFFLNGYQEATRNVTTSAAEESTVSVTLDPITSSVLISATPADAELFVNGTARGKVNQTVELLAASQIIEIRREGYVPYTTTFISRPGLEQKLEVALKSLEQQRIESIKPEIVVNGQTLKLIYPGNFVMGASRREAGRQANEVIRNVSLTKAFYLSVTEVSNSQYAEFDAEHSSGVVEGRTLSNPTQPVVRVAWDQAAQYCNWLSEKENLMPFYQIEGDKVVGVNADSTGYRLPTEAEWEWAARVAGDPNSLLRFPWGAELPPPENHGNYADISAASFLGRILVNYNDSFMGSSPVGSFPPNVNGFYDMGGNAAEWVHDYYGTGAAGGSGVEVDPVGPTAGSYHVVRGSSWAHGTVTELRLSFRDYSDTTRDDVGFRVARYLGN